LSKADAERTFDTITNTILDALKGDDTVKLLDLELTKWLREKLELEETREQVNKFKSLLLKK
jgi:chemotaxis regulatin CheY-phosphate phosphatase CheZ